MTIKIIAVSAALLLSAAAVPAGAATAVKQENISFNFVEASITTAKVEDINYQARTVKLLMEDGSVRTVNVSRDVKNFQNTKVGDVVTMDVNQDISVEVRPGAGEPMNVGTESETGSMPGEKPQIVRTIEGVLRTRVENIDYEKRTFSCKNRRGVLTTYKVGKDAKRFNEVQRGDMLYIEYKQTVAISVK
jgi:hypothetical protein